MPYEWEWKKHANSGYLSIRATGVADFNDLLAMTVSALEENPVVDLLVINDATMGQDDFNVEEMKEFFVRLKDSDVERVRVARIVSRTGSEEFVRLFNEVARMMDLDLLVQNVSSEKEARFFLFNG